MLRWRKKYGPVFTIWIPGPVIVIADYENLKEALLKNARCFSGRPHNPMWSVFYGDDQSEGDGIILSEGERWHHNRELARTIFKTFKLSGEQLEARVRAHVDYLEHHVAAEIGNKETAQMDMHIPIAYCVGNIIQDLVLGKSYPYGDPEFDGLKRLIDSTLHDAGSISVLLANQFPWLATVLPVVRRYLTNGFLLRNRFMQLIDEHEEALSMDGEAKDFMEAYLREVRRNPGHEHIRRRSLCFVAADLWTGGMETTVTTMRWAIMYMIYNPSVQRHCQNEIDKIFGPEPAVYARKYETPYILATLSEVQRISNVLPWAIPHRTMSDVYVDGYFISKGTEIMPQYGCLLHDPNIFPNPEQFLPDRFLDVDGLYRPRIEMRPFGMGARVCLGEFLARCELYLIFTTLLQNFTFTAVEGVQLPSLVRNEGMTAVPQNYIVCVRPRERNY
ncbi:unnamed protein product [Cylicocyclus nassatus]|uniref:Cytochrome P450 n=1 Tax=Cylicocyclus nassatus TaxID=53992 RepID=A0AA36HEZ5_CYLNA|nr:unnamed protein product [Cylicocyclus nassatus]